MTAAEDIFGKSLQILKGRTTRTKNQHVRGTTLKVPITILERYQDVQLTGDVMFVNGIRFIITKSCHIQFMTVERIPNSKDATLMKSILQIKQIYRYRGFKIDTILMDGEFASLEKNLLGEQIKLNLCSNNEHVGDIERLIRTVKERTCGIYNTLPFENFRDDW